MGLMSGRITVTTAGTAVAGPNLSGTFLLMADPGNTGTYMYIGNDGANDVTSANGYPVEKGDKDRLWEGNLANLRVDSDTNGDKLAYLKISSFGEVSSPGVA